MPFSHGRYPLHRHCDLVRQHHPYAEDNVASGNSGQRPWHRDGPFGRPRRSSVVTCPVPCQTFVASPSLSGPGHNYGSIRLAIHPAWTALLLGHKSPKGGGRLAPPSPTSCGPDHQSSPWVTSASVRGAVTTTCSRSRRKTSPRLREVRRLNRSELLQVGLQVAGIDRALVGAEDPPLEQTRDAMYAWHRDMGRIVR